MKIRLPKMNCNYYGLSNYKLYLVSFFYNRKKHYWSNFTYLKFFLGVSYNFKHIPKIIYDTFISYN